ncbi:alpha/beta hydrolase [Haliangium sp.]|uniref:alpha/beta hydrolase n=1 Tax=Haliangium sp. TaxID=2663208 RepID=UPI003D118C67
MHYRPLASSSSRPAPGRRPIVSVPAAAVALWAALLCSAAGTAQAAEIHVHYDTGFGNFISVRGSGAGLSWSQGSGATWTAGNDWVLTTPASSGGFEFKPLFNDSQWSVGANYVVPSGDSVVHVYPFFGPAQGSLHTISGFFSQNMQDSRDITIYLPPSYTENAAKQYPVLYMHDGQNLFHDSEAFGGVAWEVDDTIDSLIAQGRMREVIVVAVDNDADRISEYTPVPDPDYGGGNGESYLDFLQFELKPFIEANYRVLTGPANTLIGGSSLGGLISFWAAWTRPQVFGTAVCMSSSFWWNDRFLIDTVAGHTGAKVPVVLYIDAGGQNDGATNTADMRDTLESKGYVHGADLFHWFEPSGAHNEASWEARFYVPMERVLPFQ